MSAKKDRRPHATISTDVASPAHTYVEKIHTPVSSHSSHSGKTPADMTADDWDHEKHAHLDADVASPHGLVPRRATPTLKSGLGFEEHHAHVANEVASPHGLVKRQSTPTCKTGLKCSFEEAVKADEAKAAKAAARDKTTATAFALSVAAAVACAIIFRKA